MKHIQPKALQRSFTCPNCGTISMQDWWYRAWNDNRYGGAPDNNDLRVGTCQHCEESTLWVMEKMVYPESGTAPFPNTDMPESVLILYREATSIHSKSPRGAAALLRLAIQLLCKELGETGQDINSDIGSLVNKGLPKVVQQSLDIVRVTGNEAVHPGQIDTDDPETVGKLFELVNVIVEYTIALPKRVSGIYEALPEEKRKGIERRDS